MGILSSQTIKKTILCIPVHVHPLSIILLKLPHTSDTALLQKCRFAMPLAPMAPANFLAEHRPGGNCMASQGTAAQNPDCHCGPDAGGCSATGDDPRLTARPAMEGRRQQKGGAAVCVVSLAQLRVFDSRHAVSCVIPFGPDMAKSEAGSSRLSSRRVWTPRACEARCKLREMHGYRWPQRRRPR